MLVKDLSYYDSVEQHYNSLPFSGVILSFNGGRFIGVCNRFKSSQSPLYPSPANCTCQ